jgi:hypothetical protein
LATAKPTEHFDGVALPDAPAERSNRVGDGTLVERCDRNLDVRFDENVWLERERAVQSLPEEQSNDRLVRISAREGLDLTQGRLPGEDLAQPTAARLQRRDDIVRVAKRLPLDRNRDRHRLSPNAFRLP